MTQSNDQPRAAHQDAERRAEALMQAGDFAAARMLLGDLLARMPGQAHLLYLRGACAFEMQLYAEALADLESAAKSLTPFADLFFRAGMARHFLGDRAGAMAALAKAIELDPQHLLALTNLGQWYLQANRPRDALMLFDRGLEVGPHPSVLNNRAVVRRALGDLAGSLADTDAAIRVAPDMPEAHQNRAAALHDLGDMAGAVAAFRRVLALTADNAEAVQQISFIRRVICDWEALGEDDAALVDRLNRPGPLQVSIFGLLPVAPVSAALFADVAKRSAAPRCGAAMDQPPMVAPNLYRARQRVRIGYLSGDFYEHATVWLLAGVLARHDRAKIAVHVYSYGQRSDAATQRVADLADVFHHMPEQSDEAIARQIAADEVDILVDLKGPTQHMRPAITALRPAPVLVNWLGFPGTFGHPRLADYLIGDQIVTPFDCARFYSETLVHLPHCCQPNDRARQIGAKPSRIEAGLPERGLVFGSFNQSYKIDPNIFALWLRLLAVVPGSVLWQLESYPDALKNLRESAAAAGIDPARIVGAPKLGQTAHLGRLQLVDLALDTFPFNGHTTTSDALWAGVPVVTMMGETFASRVAASVLSACGLDDLVTTNAQDYWELAHHLASEPQRLAAVRERLAANRLTTPLFDTDQFVADLERAYAKIWEQQRLGVRAPFTS